MSEVPRPVDDAITFWREGNGQGAVAWSEAAWKTYFGSYDILRRLQNPLSRKQVVDVFCAVKDESTAVDAFIAAMVWGYGKVGYGAWRTDRILKDTDDAAKRLRAIHEETKKGGGPAGFRAMAEQRLRHLGVAFGTKFLFFSAEAGQPEVLAPVLDRIVRAWLAENVGLRLDIWSWRRPQDYELYCTKLAEWGGARKLTPGQVEEAIFEYATRGPQAPEALPRRVESILEELSELIERSRVNDDDKAAVSECLEKIGRLLDEE